MQKLPAFCTAAAKVERRVASKPLQLPGNTSACLGGLSGGKRTTRGLGRQHQTPCHRTCTRAVVQSMRSVGLARTRVSKHPSTKRFKWEALMLDREVRSLSA